MMGVEVSDTCSPAYMREIIKMERIARMIDVKNIKVGSKITLSDGSSHVLKHIGVGKNFHDLDFEDGYSVYDFSNNGVSDVNPSLHITAVETPKEKVDLSTLMVGDVCILRNGQRVPASNIIMRSGNNFPFIFVPENDEHFETCRQNGTVWAGKESPQDIVKIERSTALERAKIHNDLIDKPIFEIGY